MPDTATHSASTVNGPATAGKRERKPRRLDANGKPMRRLVIVLSETDYSHVNTAITCRVGPLFVKVYGGEKISSQGPEEEFRGKALASICENWQTRVESDK